MKMKILMIIPYFYPEIGGAEFAAYEVSRWLAREGHEVKVVTKHLGEFGDHEIIDGVEVYRARGKRIKGLQSLTAIPRMVRLALKLAPSSDLVHAHIPYPSAFIAYLIKKLRGKPYLVTSQGSELLDYPEEKPLKLIKPLTSIALRNADHVHAISGALKESIINNFGIEGERITVIPNGVDSGSFHPGRGRKNPERKEKVIVSVSRLTLKNGIDYLIKALPKVLEEVDCRLVVIGEGEQRGYLEGLVEELGLEERVELRGWVEYEKVAEIVASADLFARPSLTEGLGTAFLEAMACGTPVIGTKVQGILDIVEDGYNGILVSPGEVEKLSRSMVKVLKDESLRENLVQNGLSFVEKYRWENIGSQYFKLYQEILSQ